MRWSRRLPRDLAMIVLGLFLLLYGLFAVLPIGFPGAGLLLGLLALVAGALILLRR